MSAPCLYTVTGWGVMSCVCGMAFCVAAHWSKYHCYKQASSWYDLRCLKATSIPNKQKIIVVKWLWVNISLLSAIGQYAGRLNLCDFCCIYFRIKKINELTRTRHKQPMAHTQPHVSILSIYSHIYENIQCLVWNINFNDISDICGEQQTPDVGDHMGSFKTASSYTEFS